MEIQSTVEVPSCFQIKLLNSHYCKVEIVPLLERDNYEMKQNLIFYASHFGLSHDDSPLSWDLQTSHLYHCPLRDLISMSHVLHMGDVR